MESKNRFLEYLLPDSESEWSCLVFFLKMAAEESSKFDINAVYDNLIVALHEDDDVKLDHYIRSYNELNK